MKILVTGASGFIGRHVVAALSGQRSIDIVAAGRSFSDFGDDVAFEPTNLLVPGAATALVDRVRPSHLVHLAWEARPGRFWTSPDNFAWCAASLELLKAFAAAGGRRAVLTGSCAEYAWDEAVLDEAQTPTRPATFYGEAKSALCRLALAWSMQVGLSLAWGRVFWLYGPGEPLGRLVPDIASALVEGRVVELTAGSQQRDFLHVADVAGAIIGALQADYRGAFNIGSGEPTSVRAVAEQLARLVGREDLLSFGAKPTAANEPPCLVAATEVLRREIGFVARYSLAEGLADTLAWRMRQGCR